MRRGRLSIIIGLLTVYVSPGWAQFGQFDQTVDWPLGGSHIEGEVTVDGSGSNAVYTVTGNGAFGVRIEEGLGSAGDEGFYVYTNKTGSFSLEAKLFPFFGQTALMIREVGDDPTSNFYAIELELEDTGIPASALFRTRTGAGGNVNIPLEDEEGNPIEDTGEGLWFRITRVEPVDIFFSEYSPNGEDWFIADSRVIEWPSDTAAFGIAAGSGADDENLGEVEVSNVSFIATPPVARRTLSQQSFNREDTIEVTISVFISGEDRSTATIEEMVPEGWPVSNVSNGGTESGGVISWSLTDLPVGETTLTYEVTAPDDPDNFANWSGFLEESVDIVGPTTIPFLDITGGDRVSEGLLVYYTFNEGGGTTVTDTSDNGDPMNLTIEDPTRVRWRDGYLETTGVNQIVTDGPASKIIDGCKSTNELTVEGWIKTSDITQNGPARIITCSLDAFARNFTLGQGRYAAGSNRFEMRFRTTENNEWQVDSPIGSLTEALTHVVWSRASDGSVMGVINNEVQEVVLEGANPIEKLPGDFSNWVESYKFGIGNEVAAARAWLGQFHLVAIYNKALSADEVAQNYNAGPFVGDETPVVDWSLY